MITEEKYTITRNTLVANIITLLSLFYAYVISNSYDGVMCFVRYDLHEQLKVWFRFSITFMTQTDVTEQEMNQFWSKMKECNPYLEKFLSE